MSTFAQLRDRGEDPIAIFEEPFLTALGKLLPDLAAAPWYVREREVVNLFVFGHLISQFKKKNLDISQLGIEVPVQKLPKSIEAAVSGPGELPLNFDRAPVPESSKRAKEARGRYADIVVWPHAKATLWQTCGPLVHIEWKHISCRTPNPRDLEQQHADDICLLQHNRSLVCVSYAILTEWHPFKARVAHGSARPICRGALQTDCAVIALSAHVAATLREKKSSGSFPISLLLHPDV